MRRLRQPICEFFRFARKILASKRRGAITSTPRQPGVEPAPSPVSSHWGWARLLQRVLAIDMARCPRCHPGTLRSLAATPYRPIIVRILRHLKLAADPLPIAEVRLEQVCFT